MLVRNRAASARKRLTLARAVRAITSNAIFAIWVAAMLASIWLGTAFIRHMVAAVWGAAS